MPHLLLQLEDAIHQRLRSRRATRHIHIHGHNTIAPSRYTIAIMIVATAVRTTAHTHNPSRLGHLIIHLSQGRCHLVCQCAGYDHNIGLTWRSAEDYTEAILIVAGRGEMHHFDGAAGEAEGHGPEGALTGPIGDLIEGC